MTKLAAHRSGQVIKFQVGDIEGYVVTGLFPDGALGEIFMHVTKHGSTLGGWADAFAIAFSGCLQQATDPRTALEWLVSKLIRLSFEPNGMTGDSVLPQATSVIDYIVRALALSYLSAEARERIERRVGFPIQP